MIRILVLCTGNSCRSQMAEGYLKYYGKDSVEIFSAGVEVHSLNPLAMATMKEDGIDISKQTSNNIEEYRNVEFDFVITVCDNARDKCPVFYTTAKRFHHDFKDPSRVKGTEKEILNAFRKVREEINEYCKAFIADNVLHVASA